MAEKRQRKVESAIPHLPKARRVGDPKAPIGILTINSGYGACLDTVEILADKGIHTELFQPRTIWPVLEETLEWIASKDHVYVVEQNSSKQLAGLLTREGASHDQIENLLRYDGIPLRPYSIAGEIEKREGERS